MTLNQQTALHTKLTQARAAISHGAPVIAQSLLLEACALLLAVPTTQPAQPMTPHQLADFDKTGRLPSPH